MAAHVSLGMPGSTPGNEQVGHGTIFDSSAMHQPTTSASSSSTLPQWSGSASQYRLKNSEVLKGVANRFVHSTAYLYLYASMALASLFTVLLSLINECPGDVFYIVEMLVNVVLVVEVGVRFVAFGRQFWHSTFNVLDLFLVLLCTLTLLIIFFSHTCSPYNRNNPKAKHGRTGKSEELFDSFLLVFRNGMQLMRLLAVVRRSGRNAWTGRPRGIELDPGAIGAGGAGAYGGRGAGQVQQGQRRRGGAAGAGGQGGAGAANDFSLDIDLEDDAAATRNRMRQGGGSAAPERQHLMHGGGSGADDDEEEEL